MIWWFWPHLRPGLSLHLFLSKHVSWDGGDCSSFPAIPEFHKKLPLLSFWTKCCSPIGVYHSSADRVIKQLEASFARTVNRDYPGLADPGTGLQRWGSTSVVIGFESGCWWGSLATCPAASLEKRLPLQRKHHPVSKTESKKDAERFQSISSDFEKHYMFLLVWKHVSFFHKNVTNRGVSDGVNTLEKLVVSLKI